MPGWLIAALVGAAAFLVGLATGVALLRRRADALPEPAAPNAGGNESERPAPASRADVEPAEDESSAPPIASLLAGALRAPLLALRRADVSPELIARVERVAWQARMLAARPRPMKAQPASAIALLQAAAEEVEELRLGKVGASWGLFTRQPVHVDPERAQGAFRELLAAAAAGAGSGGRFAVRVHQGEREGYPVAIEIEIGRQHAEPDPLAALVARRLLEGQGARVGFDGPIVRIELRALPPPDPD